MTDSLADPVRRAVAAAPPAGMQSLFNWLDSPLPANAADELAQLHRQLGALRVSPLTPEQRAITLDRLQLLNEKGGSIAFTSTPAENNMQILQPTQALVPGRYCLVLKFNPEKTEALYWCLKVID